MSTSIVRQDFVQSQQLSVAQKIIDHIKRMKCDNSTCWEEPASMKELRCDKKFNDKFNELLDYLDTWIDWDFRHGGY